MAMEYFERYLVVDCGPNGLMLRIDQWPEPLSIPPKGRGVHCVLTKSEAEDIVPRAVIDSLFADKRASYGTSYPSAIVRGADAKLHIDVEITGKHRDRLLASCMT